MPTRVPINSNAIFHRSIREYWRDQKRCYFENRARIKTRFDREIDADRNRTIVNGDVVLQKVTDMFYNGMGRIWSEVQARIFESFVDACLPLIYGDAWPDNKLRVLKERGLTAEQQYALVNMARRNGKTFVTSGAAAALMLCVPGITLAIFSTCRRTSQMMMSAIIDQLESAFTKGTHAIREQFSQVSKNMEQLMYEGPDGTRRLLMSLPGSVRVSSVLFLLYVLCVCVCVKKCLFYGVCLAPNHLQAFLHEQSLRGHRRKW